jgi:hypothetical protein
VVYTFVKNEKGTVKSDFSPLKQLPFEKLRHLAARAGIAQRNAMQHERTTIYAL